MKRASPVPSGAGSRLLHFGRLAGGLAVGMAAKGGAAVLVGVLPIDQTVALSASDITLQEKRVLGSFMGSNAFRRDMPQYVDFYLDGRLRLDEMISKRISLDEINPAFDAMKSGEVARSVIVFD